MSTRSLIQLDMCTYAAGRPAAGQTGDLSANLLCTLMTSGKWTVCGRYMNHDLNPNIKAAADTGVLVGIAIREINEGDEFTLNYRQIKDALSAASPELVGSFHQQKARLLASLTEREASEPHIPHKPRTNEMEK